MAITNNTKYTSYLDIYTRLASKLKNKEFDEADVIEWCAECEIELLGDTERLMTYTKTKVIISNLQGKLPCNLFRLLDVFKYNDERIYHYTNNGEYLAFGSTQTFDVDDDGNDYVLINYYGIAVDPKTGYPLIKKGHEQACEAFCIFNIYFEDFLNNKIDLNRWQVINERKEDELRAAASDFRNIDSKDLERMNMIMLNMIPKVGEIPMYHLQWEDQ